MVDRTVLLESEYFEVEKIPVEVSRSSESLRGPKEEAAGLAYLFAAEGTGRISSPSFETLDLPARSVVAIPASSPVFAIQDIGALDLMRITPRWPVRGA
jgi:mannose-6-phosphate isomerase